MIRSLTLTLSFLSLSWTVWAQTPEPAASIPPQSKTTDNVVLPVPSEIFAALDKFENSNWRAVQRPEVAHWKSRGDQSQIALLLGVQIAEGFIAVEARDAKEIDEIGTAVLKLARALGVEGAVLKRSRSIIDQAHAENWAAVRKEWNAVLSDVETAMKDVRSNELPQLVSLGGWLRGTEALSALVLQNYSAETAALLHQPALLDNFAMHLNTLRRTQHGAIVATMQEGLEKARPLIAGPEEHPARETVEKLAKICRDLLNEIRSRS